MSKQIFKEIDESIDNLEKEIKEKYDYGLQLIKNLEDKTKENPDYLFVMNEPTYNKMMEVKDKNETSIIEVSNDIDKSIEKIQNIKTHIEKYIEMNNKLGMIINNQRIGSLLHHSVKASEQVIKDNKIKIKNTVFDELLKNANFTIKNSKKEGGNLKRKQSRRRNK
jgi:regulator of replication initiation timing